MFVNILIFLVLLALTVGAGWLTWRAVRAQRRWVKIAGGLGAGVLTLALAAVTFASGSGLAAFYFPGASPVRNLQVAGTPEQVARGEYLVNIGCIGCHGAVDANGNPSGEYPLSGGWNIAAAEGFGFIGDVVIENLTPGGKLAAYSDGELFRAIRHGINKDGHLLVFMPLLPFGQMSDNDIEAVIAYLRSQPATPSDTPRGDQVNFLGVAMFGAGMFPSPEAQPDTIAAPPAGTTTEYGKYVATFGECRGCHGPDLLGQTDPTTGQFFPNPRTLVSSMTQEQFTEMMRTGVRPSGAAFPETMPWQNASQMTDDDLNALYAYVTAAP